MKNHSSSLVLLLDSVEPLKGEAEYAPELQLRQGEQGVREDMGKRYQSALQECPSRRAAILVSYHSRMHLEEEVFMFL